MISRECKLVGRLDSCSGRTRQLVGIMSLSGGRPAVVSKVTYAGPVTMSPQTGIMHHAQQRPMVQSASISGEVMACETLGR